MRLDEAVVERKLLPSRSRARDAILRGAVSVNGQIAGKPSQTVQAIDIITLAEGSNHYVSRAALKLIHALDHFDLSLQGAFCLDIGASTGGFTQVLLERGARHVVALDVGHGQLHQSVAQDPRVTSIEGQNARDLSAVRFPEPPQFLVSDVSFISLKLALPPALALAAAGAKLVALIKPQFEVGRDRLPRDGVVKDPDLHQSVCADISRFVESQGWKLLGIVASPIQGGDGNREYLLAAIKE